MSDLRFTIDDLRACASSARQSSIVNRKLLFLALLLVWALFFGIHAQAQQRFPPPDFESGHQLPTTTTPAVRTLWFQYLDVPVLGGCLAVASWLVYRKRSRRSLLGLSLFSLAYFGFWRKGCVCAIGSLQNVSLALVDPGYAVPVGVLAFFVLPLVFALFFGRTFCAAVCPHGALQDLVLLRPIKLPAWLEEGLSILPFIYLGAGVLFAATGSLFLICQYDPFVPVFRMSGRSLMVLSGVALLLLGVFVGRPYCRFLCPYGALLKLGSMVARRRVRVTPDYCTQCRLCEASCPFGAMLEPQAVETEPASLARDRRRLALLLVALPLLVLGGGLLGSKFSGAASTLHPTVALADRFLREQGAPPKTGVLSPDDLALQRARQHPDELAVEARAIRHKFKIGSWIFGAWIGAVVGLKLISLGLQSHRTDYEPAPGECFACARCFEFCPNELVRRGVPFLQRPPLVAGSSANRT
jgi:NosR/NirI family transcriptional regulator, nitrous oxide reductase regulator